MDYAIFAGRFAPTIRVETTVPPAVEPVTLAEAKLWMRVDFSDDDALISELIASAREDVEADAGVALITQTKTLFMSGFRTAWGDVTIPYPPLQSIASVQYMDTSGTLITIDPATYRFGLNATPGRLWLPWGTVWPVTGPYPDAVQVSYVCGFGDDATAVPIAAKMAMRLKLASRYNNREGEQFLQGGQMDTSVYDSYIRKLSYGRYG